MMVCALACVLDTAVLAQSGERQLLYKPEPSYPTILRKLNIGGVVKIQITVSPGGTVKKATLLGGNPALADPAMQAIRQWKYSAAETESVMTVEIRFNP